MRPIVSKQDPLRYPLNELFGAQAHVRLLRVMANEVEGPLTASDVAKRAGLTLPGAKKALSRLVQSGFISPVGGGRHLQYEIRRSDRLMQIALALFQAENDRYEQLIATITKEVADLKPPPHAAWIQTHPNQIEAPLIVGVLHATGHVTSATRQLRTRLNGIEQTFDLTLELEGHTKADISEVKFDETRLLYGVLPTSNRPASGRRARQLTHAEKDRRLQILTGKLAKAIEQDASLVRRAKEHIDRLLKKNQGAATGDLLEWRDILDMYSVQRLVRFLTSSSQRANRLRQSSPFFAVLNAEERSRLEDQDDA